MCVYTDIISGLFKCPKGVNLLCVILLIPITLQVLYLLSVNMGTTIITGVNAPHRCWQTSCFV